MNRPALTPALLLALALASCSTTPASGEPPENSAVAANSQRQGILPTPSGPLDLTTNAGTDLSLKELLARLSNLTGVTYSISDSTGARLEKAMVTLTRDKQVPSAVVYPWVESILSQNGFSLSVLENGSAPLVGVYSKGDRNQTGPAFNVDIANVEECRIHPATSFSTVLTLPNTDVRSVGNSLRILAPDSQTGGVVPVGMTKSVILTGSGREVADLAALLLSVDAAAKLKNDAAAEAVAPTKP